jgi:hypothetical protein
MKILVVSDEVVLVNRLAGLEYKQYRPSSPLRILETQDLQLWHVLYSDHLPLVTLMGACGLVVVSHAPPFGLLERNHTYFSSLDFPVLWLTDSRGRKETFQLNVQKVCYNNVSDPVVTSEFDHWLQKVKAYVSQ